MDDSYVASDQWKLSVYLGSDSMESAPAYVIDSSGVPADFLVFLIDNQVYDWIFVADQCEVYPDTAPSCPAILDTKEANWKGKIYLNQNMEWINKQQQARRKALPFVNGNSFSKARLHFFS